MLRELQIESFALIDRLQINFAPGLNILTGETGAGKSIIIDALNQVLGARASSELVRSDSEKALITAVFDYNPALDSVMATYGLDCAEDVLVLQREVYINGKSQARINGRPVNVGLLREVGAKLVEIHGQHEHQELLNPAAHLDLLDSYGGEEVSGPLCQYRATWERLQAVEQELTGLHGDKEHRQRTLDLLVWQVEEIEAAALTPGEDEKLLAERKLLLNGQKLLEICRQGYETLYQGDGPAAVVQILATLVEGLKKFAGLDQVLDQTAAQLEESLYTVEDSARQLRSFADQFQHDPGRLEVVEKRIDLINDLKRKFGATIEEILSWREQKLAEIEGIRTSEVRHEALSMEKARLVRDAGVAALKLSGVRKQAASRLSRSIEGELGYLQMKNTRFDVEFVHTPASEGIPFGDSSVKSGPSGADQVQFLIAPNPGEPLKPLTKIASGGEMSRIMLAVLNILVAAQPISAVVFDEIDAGIGGRAAQAVAEKLATVAMSRQVVCVSHLPQVSSMADNHFYIFKQPDGQRTRTLVRKLDATGRVEELARMLGGAEVTPATLTHAREMLVLAEQVKAKQ